MKTMGKISKKLLAILIILTTLITTNVFAVQETIELGDAPNAGDYIAGVTFSHKKTTDGKSLYCIDMHKNTAKNTKATLVKNSKNINGGIVYILKNGYPYKSITGDNKKDYYITQTAVWWYLDETTGSTNLGSYFKREGSDPHNMRRYVKQLVQEGINHKNDPVVTGVDTSLKLSTTSTNLKLTNGYYSSEEIKATTNNVTKFTISLENAPANTKIIKNGNEFPYTSAFELNSNETFKIAVPASSMSNALTASIKVNASAKGTTQYTAYEYQPVNRNMQNVALLETIEGETSDSITLTIDSSKISVLKVDYNTDQPIAGAKLVLKNSAGSVIASWTSTTNAYIIRNLANGDYTIEETEAPEGYVLNRNITNFSITDTNRNISIKIQNAPRNVVVNITKVDQETNSPLAGAVLVIKDSNGAVVARFTSTTSSYVTTSLKNGTYTVEEESAPAGYIRNDQKITFTIDDDHLSHQIIIKNAKEVIVPDTDSTTSIIMIILGITITAAGLTYVYKFKTNK